MTATQVTSTERTQRAAQGVGVTCEILFDIRELAKGVVQDEWTREWRERISSQHIHAEKCLRIYSPVEDAERGSTQRSTGAGLRRPVNGRVIR